MDRLSEQAPSYESMGKLTYKDYLGLPDDGFRYELLDGFLVQEPAPTPHHQRVVGRLFRLLTDYFSGFDPKGEVFVAPLDIKLSHNTIVQPDLLYVSGKHYKSTGDYPNIFPDLVVEILSPSTKVRDRMQKAELYRQGGIPHYWLIDPEVATIEALQLQGEHYSIVASAYEKHIFTHPEFPELSIDIEAACRQPS